MLLWSWWLRLGGRSQYEDPIRDAYFSLSHGKKYKQEKNKTDEKEKELTDEGDDTGHKTECDKSAREIQKYMIALHLITRKAIQVLVKR